MIFEYLIVELNGLATSLSLTVVSLILALILALLFTAILALKTKIISWFVQGYIILFTGTPLLIQFFLIYYGPGQFYDFFQNFPKFWQLISNPWFCALLTLTLNSAAYTTLLFHGAVKAIPKGQWQACDALGMSAKQTLKILLPYAVKRSLSSYSNEVVLIFKSTSLAFTITLMDIIGHTQQLYGNNYDAKVYISAGIIYLVVNGLLTLLMRGVEKRALRFENR